jgi:glycosyltransferase involved in cell wall biosynthesis
VKSGITIVCVGPSAAVLGGVSALAEKIIAHLPPHIKVTRIGTYSAYTGYDQSYRISFLQPFVFLSSLIAVSFLAFLHPRAVFHVHLSQRGSTLRKGIVCILLRVIGSTFVVHAHADAAFHEQVPAAVRRVLMWGLGGAHYFITLTQQWRDFYVNNLGVPSDKLLVLPNPSILPPAISSYHATGATNILFLGRVGERKGTFDLIQALASLPKDLRQQCHLVLAGDGDLKHASSMVEELGCSDQVSVLGWVSRREVDRLLSESDVLALPSHMEGMALAVLEAMAWGIPVVTTSVGGSDEFLTPNHNCLLVKPGDIQGIACALAELIRDPQLRQRLGKEGRKTAECFSIDKYIVKLTRLYEELATGSSESDRIQPELKAE